VTEADLDKWLRSGKYLPPILRDFHDQKDFFKFIGQRVAATRKRDQERGESTYTLEEFNWVRFHVITIDFFLWFMAMNGYTLQRSRQRLPFRDYATTIKESRDEWLASLAASGAAAPGDGKDMKR